MSNETESSKIINFSKLTVLIYESSNNVKKGIKFSLEEIGFVSSNIITCDTSNECEKVCKAQSFDIYIINLSYTDNDRGMHLLHDLHNQNLIPIRSVVCIMTSDNSRAMVLSTIEIRPDELIIKPYSIIQLKNRIYRAYLKKNELIDIYQAQENKDWEALIEMCYKHLGFSSVYNQDIRIMLAEAQTKLNRYQDAKVTIMEALSFSESIIFHLELGKIHYLLDEYDDAIDELKLSVNSKPLMMESYKWLFKTYLKKDEIENAQNIIKKAVEISPKSSSLLHMQIEFGLNTHRYSIIKDAFDELLDIHKYDSEKLCQLLTGYVQSEIMYVIDEPNMFNLDKLPKHVNSVLSRTEPYLKHLRSKFNFKLFRELSTARIDLALGKTAAGRKQLYKTLAEYESELESQPNSVIANVALGLWQLGDFEYAEEMFKQKINESELDPLLKASIKTYQTDPKIKDKMDKYQKFNKMGIQCYKENDFEKALEYFGEALKKSPSNTNANINKAQVLVKLANKEKNNEFKRKNYLDECRETLVALNSMFTSNEQKKRINGIKTELDNIKQVKSKN